MKYQIKVLSHAGAGITISHPDSTTVLAEGLSATHFTEEQLGELLQVIDPLYVETPTYLDGVLRGEELRLNFGRSKIFISRVRSLPVIHAQTLIHQDYQYIIRQLVRESPADYGDEEKWNVYVDDDSTWTNMIYIAAYEGIPLSSLILPALYRKVIAQMRFEMERMQRDLLID